MRLYLTLGILCILVTGALAFGDDAGSPQPSPAEGTGTTQQAPSAGSSSSQTPKPEDAKLLTAVKEALERNAVEIKSLKEQYAKDMAEQRKKIDEQARQIATLEQSAQVLQDRLKAQTVSTSGAGGLAAQDPARQQKINELQQKQINVLEQTAQAVSDELERQAPLISKLQGQTATLESREKQAALRDQELANAHDSLLDSVDAQLRNPSWLPPPLKEYFLPSGTNVTPLSIYSTLATRYDLFPSQRGAGILSFEGYSPFFLVQLNNRSSPTLLTV
jgi:DNA repair exonuclease SbcCD ATPase subunit